MRPPSRWCRLFLLVCVCIPVVRAERLVLARSTVTNDYLENRMKDGKLQPQTYVFMPGRFLPGTTRDKSLEKMSFRTIAERLAVDLRRQEFHPAAALQKADLLLVVHWGATAGRNRDSVELSHGFETLANMNHEAEEARGALAEAVEAGDFMKAALVRENLDSLASQSAVEAQSLLSEGRGPGGADTAALLGLTTELQKEGGTLAEQERRKTLHEMTREECYFVIVMAYDARTLVETRKFKRVWSLRTSINTAGVNFPEALDRVAQVAGQYFGTRQKGVSFDYPPGRRRKETVTVEDIVVLGTVDP
ncbi:MAG TPA: hypothetical protein PKX00_06210 [Opitutaceae bacterium]|jgi:hypothetical protein|nr:hypothetical protein [Opitutaceae bacterium]